MTEMNLSCVVPLEAMRGEDDAETAQLRSMHEVAISFMQSFAWCGRVLEAHFGGGIGNVVALFLVQIQPTKSDVDSWLWVIVGDLPPAYIVAKENPTPKEALRGYIEEMRLWADAVLTGKPVDKLIPVNAPPTAVNAGALQTRLAFLDEKILPRLR